MIDRCFHKHRDNGATDKEESDEAATFDFVVASDVEVCYDAAEVSTVRVIPPARIVLIHLWEAPRPEPFQQMVKHEQVLLDFPARLALGGVVVYLERCMDDRWQHLPPLPNLKRYQAKCLFGMAMILTALPGSVLTAWAEQQGANYLRPPIMISSFVLGIVLFRSVVKRYVAYYYQPFYRRWLESLKKQLFDLRRSLRQQQFSANAYDLQWNVDSSAQDGSVLVHILTGKEVQSAKPGSSIDKTRKTIKVPDDILRNNETIREKPAWERLSNVTMWHWGALSLTLRHKCPNFERHHSFRHWVLVMMAVIGWVVLFQELFPDGNTEFPELLFPYFLGGIAVLLLAWQLALWYTERFVAPGKHAAFRTAVSDCSQPSLPRTSYVEKDPSQYLVCGCFRMRIVPGVVQFDSDDDEQSNHASAIATTRVSIWNCPLNV